MFARFGKNAAPLAVFSTLAFLSFADRSIAAEPVLRPALDGVFAAFNEHPLVGIVDEHDLADEGEFYDGLIKDPRFAAQVGNVVVEFGGAAHQDTLDRYLAGEEVSYGKLRQIWSDVVGWIPTVTSVVYQNFFAQVRSVNLQLPPDRRIRVWLGEPAIDWSTIHKHEDLDPYMSRRNEHPAQIIEREILARGRKALVIYGGFHFYAPPPPSGAPPMATLKGLVERTRPGAFYVITPYVGYAQASCAVAFEAEMKWPKGTLAAPVKSTSLESALLRPGCSFGDDDTSSGPPGALQPSPAEQARLRAGMEEIMSGAAGDALLYLGPAASLMRSPDDPALVMDGAYFREISRRLEIMTGQPAKLSDWVSQDSRPPQPFLAR